MLHGRAGNARLFESLMQAMGWLDSLRDLVEFVFIDGPYTCRAAPELYAGLAARGLYGQAPAYFDFGLHGEPEASAASVEAAVSDIEKRLVDSGPFHAIGGICDGALIAAVVASRQTQGPILYLNIAGAPIECLPLHLQKNHQMDNQMNHPSFHILGRKDETYAPTALSSLVNSCADAVVFWHPRGHAVPVLGGDLERRVRSWLLLHRSAQEGIAPRADPRRPEVEAFAPFASVLVNMGSMLGYDANLERVPLLAMDDEDMETERASSRVFLSDDNDTDSLSRVFKSGDGQSPYTVRVGYLYFL